MKDKAAVVRVKNEQIRDLDFFTARISDGVISLFDRESVLISEISFEEYDKNLNKEIVYIRKEDTLVYFILMVMVDDEIGIMFVNDDSDWILSGLNSVERIGAGSYKHDTAQKAAFP